METLVFVVLGFLLTGCALALSVVGITVLSTAIKAVVSPARMLAFDGTDGPAVG